MELLLSIDVARNLTVRLQKALEAQDMETCRDLLEFRYQAMVDFECAHRAASDQDRNSCREKMVACRKQQRQTWTWFSWQPKKPWIY